MKLGPLEVRRHTLAAAQPTPQKPSPREEYGASGTQNLDGFLQTHEYNRELQHPQSIAVYRRMIRSDPDVQEARSHIRMPVLNATANVEPASDDPLDLEVAAFVRSAYFDWPAQPEGDEWPFGSFSEYVSILLRYLDWGFTLMETPLKLVEDELEWETPAGETMSRRRQWLTWAKFAERLPETIHRWHLEEGKLVSVEQWVWKDDTYATVTIPASAFLLLCNDREGDDFFGVSTLRSAWKPFLIKETVEKIMGVAAERHGTGVNTAYVPNSAKADQGVIDRVEAMMRDLNGGDRPYLVFPGAKGEVTSTNNDGGYLFEIVTPNSSALPDLVKFCEYLRGSIKGNMLVRFAELGHGQTGARATGDTQSQVWYDALHAVAKAITDVSAVAIRRLVDLNYSIARYPKLVFQDIESRNLEEFAIAHSRLVIAQAINPDATYRRFVREVLGAPDEDKPDETAGVEPVEEETQPGEKPGGQPVADPDAPEDTRTAPETPDEEGPMVRAVELMTQALETLRAAADREQPAPVVHVEPTPVTVEVPAQEPPVVHVTSPEITFPAEMVETLALLREFAAREPEPTLVQVEPTVTVELPQVAEAIQAMAAQVENVAAREIHVDVPQTTVEIPELRDLLLALADRPDPVAPVVNVDLADIEGKLDLTLATVADAVNALAGREVPAPVVNLDLSDLTESIRELAQPSAHEDQSAQHEETVRLLTRLTDTVASLAGREQAAPVVHVEPLDLDALRVIAETLAAQPERPPVELSIGEGGIVNVDPGADRIAERLEQLAVALADQPAPVINQAAPVVNIDLAPLVSVLQQLAAKELPAPVVNLPAPEPAETKTKTVEIRRDEYGRASGAIVKEL